MGSSGLRRYYKQDRTATTTIKPITTTKTTSGTPSSTTTATTTSPVIASIENVIRDTRSTGIFIGSQIHPTFTDKPLTTTTTTVTTTTRLRNIDFLTSERGAMNDKIITVDLTSSGDHFNDINNVESTTYQSLKLYANDNNKETTTYDGASLISSSTYEPVIEEIIYPSKEQHSLLADSSKSEFNVDEGEPITSDTDAHNVEYPASIRQLTSPKQIHPLVDGTTDLIAQHLSRDNIKDKLQPYHETVIYHNHPRDSNRARSVSYSTVIQSIPNNPSNNNNNNNKVWNIEHKTYEELNKYEEPNYSKSNDTVTNDNKNIYKSPPVVYGRPEQNYEIDEAVSVMSNGRVHGVQSSQSSQVKIQKENVDNTKTDKKGDDNQKVGYVVEGRNYRKYRVEERTSDGFIVGEYGVLSHDDGSLRGVRYTADGTTHPRVIYDALMKFLSL